jgi:hypothetical protein
MKERRPMVARRKERDTPRVVRTVGVLEDPGEVTGKHQLVLQNLQTVIEEKKSTRTNLRRLLQRTESISSMMVHSKAK